VSRLREEIEAEKQQRLHKRQQEREQAWRIINQNQDFKARQLQQKENDKIKENQAIEEYNKLIEKQEQRRAQEWQQREQRIQDLMSKMADTVVKRSNDQEKELERRVMRYQYEKEERDMQQEIKKKEEMRKKHEEIK
jgi:hypothetical protein